MRRDLFVFAGQSNMVGASVFPPKYSLCTKNSYEYKHKMRRLGMSTGEFVPAGYPVGTKVDKIKESELQRNVQVYKDKLAEEWEELPPIFITSSEKEIGKEDVLNYIEHLNDEMKEVRF